MARLAEADRLDAWKIPAFLFEMSDTGLVRSEVTLPTCHLSSFVAEPARDVAAIPVSAVAQIEFQLVPDQHPDQVIDLLRAHLHERGYGDIEITPLPGSYGPARHDGEHPFVQRLVAAGQHIYGRPLPRLPLGAFAQPLRLLSDTLDAPAVALALARASCASYGPNEHVLLDDLLRHSQLIAAVLATTRAQRQVLLGAVELNS
jgi:acetylornithine deacetylase/succinyl-diaminopimelate desuccinylase-like protein